jgi:hypothetical protein
MGREGLIRHQQEQEESVMNARIVCIILLGLACNVYAVSVAAQEGEYYVLDGFGGVHAGNGASVIFPATPYFGFDVAADIEFFQTQGTVAAGILVLDRFGGVHRGGGLTTEPPGNTPYFGFNIARAIVARDTKPRIMGVSVSGNGVATGGAFDVDSVVRVGVGHYLITFDRSVSSCVWSVTLGRESSVSVAAHSPVEGQASGTQSTGGTLRVSTMDSDGNLTDRAFHVVVMCRQS